MKSNSVCSVLILKFHGIHIHITMNRRKLFGMPHIFAVSMKRYDSNRHMFLSDNETVYEDKYFIIARLLNAYVKNIICITIGSGIDIPSYLKTSEIWQSDLTLYVPWIMFRCVDKPTRCSASYERTLLSTDWPYMFWTITSPSSGASSHKLFNALVCSCRRVYLLCGCTSTQQLRLAW